MAAWAKALGQTSKEYSENAFQLRGRLGELNINVKAPRDALCERVVVGTKLVMHPARPAQTETVEIVEWRCVPLLGEMA